MAKDTPETNPITIKPETVNHVAEQFSWVPLPYCSPPRCPFPIKSLALSAHVSSDNSFLSVRQEPALGALKGGLPLPTTVPLNIGQVGTIDTTSQKHRYLGGGRKLTSRSLTGERYFSWFFHFYTIANIASPKFHSLLLVTPTSN